MKFKILLVILILVLVNSSFAHPFYYKIDLSYNKEEIDIKNINIVFLDEKIENKGNYLIKLLDGNKILDTFNFKVSNKILVDELNEDGKIIDGGLLELNQTEFELYVPYYENAREIVIYDKEGKELEKIDVSIYAKDKEKILDEKEKDNILLYINNDEEKKNKIIYVIITSILILIGLLLIIYYLKKRETK